MIRRVLVAFDFDYTIIQDNSDTYVKRLAPQNGKIPAEISQLYSSKGWTNYMAAIFKYLHCNGTTKSQLLDCVAEIPLIDGMSELFKFLSAGYKIEGSQAHVAFDAIIISDSNSVFIERILQQCGVNNVFSSVYTNPASFDADGCLSLKPFHLQDWCDISSVNMCKGHILDDHRQRGKPAYDLVAYVGDGANDLCPSLRLLSSDLVFARQGYTLAERIADVDGQKPVAKVVLWDTGFQILEALRGELSRGMK